MKRTEWFSREFPPIADNGRLPTIVERLDGTAARLFSKTKNLEADLTAHPEGKWSIKKEVGHLLDLEPMWFERAGQILDGEINLVRADLTNRRTYEADHDSREIADLIGDFEKERGKLTDLLRAATDADLEKAAFHPRLGTPMRLIDLAFFVAEHDDHHLAQISALAGE